jgi:nitrite reductase/ring-hydroxylating ferredoxin subunit
MKSPECTDHCDGLSRRGWIKRFLFGSAVSPSCAALFLSEVTEAAQSGPGVLKLSVATYPALATVGGSVQLNFSPIYKPLTINRATSTVFVTLDSVCTHSGCTVNKFLTVNGYMMCPCHGSRYDVYGRVIGGPADTDLVSYKTTFSPSSNVITVEVPSLGLNVNSISFHSRSGNTTRLKLTFQVTAFSIYEVRYQSSLTGAYTVVPFATTPTGAATEMELEHNDDGERTVYVDAAGNQGFFVVAIVMSEV